MNSLLTTHIRAFAARPFGWGDADCATFCAAWVKTVSGIDLTNGLKAHDKDHAVALTEGDLVAFAAGACEAAGLIETSEPMRGDIGVILIGADATCAIRTLNGWAVKSADGVTISKDEAGKASLLMAWCVPVREPSEMVESS